MTNRARIERAKSGGFAVYINDPEDEYTFPDDLVFAGSLQDCLEYLEREFTPVMVAEPGSVAFPPDGVLSSTRKARWDSAKGDWVPFE